MKRTTDCSADPTPESVHVNGSSVTPGDEIHFDNGDGPLLTLIVERGEEAGYVFGYVPERGGHMWVAVENLR